MEDDIVIRFTGKGVKPGLVRSREIAELLEAVEDVLTIETIQSNPNLTRDDVVIGLYAIKDESLGLAFKTNFTEEVQDSFIKTASAVNDDHFADLHPQSIKSLKVISKFSKKHQCDAELRFANSKEPLAKITAQTQIPDLPVVKGLTELLGKIVRVGGKTPKAALEQLDGTTIYCDVDVSMAKELGHQLYSLATFTGNATWDFQSLKLLQFEITSFEVFKNADPHETLSKISSLIGHKFEDITNVEEFVDNLRKGN